MGVTLEKVESILTAVGVAPPARVLDIGCSNIHTMTAAQLVDFVQRYTSDYEPQSLRRWAEWVAAGGVMDPVVGGANGAWLGDVLSRAGFVYKAFDIFPGYRTQYFDLNSQVLSEDDRGKHDLVLNLGTTEHLIGQLNAFRVIHDAAAVGGVMVHDLPMTGYLDHGYFSYNPMLFAHLAEANGYQFELLQFSGGDGGENIQTELLARYRDLGALKNALGEERWATANVPTTSIFVVFRKVHDAPFRMALETSTTVGEVVEEISAQYGAPGAGGARGGAGLRNALSALHVPVWRRLRDPSMTLHELRDTYNAHVALSSKTPFPPTLELRMLDFIEADEPGNASHAERRRALTAALEQHHPLLRRVGMANGAAPPELALDGQEAHLDPMALSLEAILAAYREYEAKASIELFPELLEAQALLETGKRWPEDKDIVVRLGALMARLTPTLPITLAR